MELILWAFLIAFYVLGMGSFYASGYFLGRQRGSHGAGQSVAMVLRSCQTNGILGKPGTDGDPRVWDQFAKGGPKPGWFERWLLRRNELHDPETGLVREP